MRLGFVSWTFECFDRDKIDFGYTLRTPDSCSSVYHGCAQRTYCSLLHTDRRMSKRKRDPVFASGEKMALIELVQRYFDIIESKKTDAVSIKTKHDQWQKISVEFNATSSIHPRDWIVLKNCWDNLKKRAKQEQTLRNQHFLGTGGGPPKKLNDDPAIIKVLEIIRSRVSGYINSYDSDGTQILGYSQETQPSAEDGPGVEDVPVEEDVPNVPVYYVAEAIQTLDETETADVTLDWSQYTPSMLRTMNPTLAVSPPPMPVSPPPMPVDIPTPGNSQSRAAPSQNRTSRRRPVLKDSVNEKRIETIINLNKYSKEEHEANMRILKFQEEREAELLYQEKIKTEQEKIKLEILKFELSKLKD